MSGDSDEQSRRFLATPADADFVPPFSEGQLLLDKYRVEKLIGTGGIGFVMSAVNIGLDEPVALKFLRPEFLSNEEATRRFTTEARLASKIQSRHVARVLDVGTLPELGPFIVMDLLVGRDLNQILYEDGPRPVQDAVDYVMQACEALAAAHAQGIVHRDVKPDNLFLTRQQHGPDIIKILDFGICKLQSSRQSSGRKASSVQTTTALGSPSYMSPEQMRAASDIDSRADIWSLGCVLYELLAARHAFDAPTLMQICAVVLEQSPPPIHVHVEGVPPELERVILRCLEKEPENRYADVAELARALAPFASAPARGAVERCAEVLGNVATSAWQARDYPLPVVQMPEDVESPSSMAPLSTAPVAMSSEPPSARQAAARKPERARDWLTYVTLAAAVGALAVSGVRQGAETSPSTPLDAAATTKVSGSKPLTAQLSAAPERAATTLPSAAPRARAGESSAPKARPTFAAPRAFVPTAAPVGAAPADSTAPSTGDVAASAMLPAEAPLAEASWLPTEPAEAAVQLEPVPSATAAEVALVAPLAAEPALAPSATPASAPAVDKPRVDKPAAAVVAAPKRLSMRTVAAVVRKNAGQVKACFQRAQVEEGDAAGVISLVATLDWEGNVVHVRAPGSLDTNSGLSACLVATTKRWRFPALPASSALNSYTLVFE